MVTFAEYTSLAYDVAEEKGILQQLRGPGTQEVNRRFLSQLADAYKENGHSEATEAEAYQFLRANVGPP